jgi:hypothetical protein
MLVFATPRSASIIKKYVDCSTLNQVVFPKRSKSLTAAFPKKKCWRIHRSSRKRKTRLSTARARAIKPAALSCMELSPWVSCGSNSSKVGWRAGKPGAIPSSQTKSPSTSIRAHSQRRGFLQRSRLSSPPCPLPKNRTDSTGAFCHGRLPLRGV